ncbi:NAD-dependent epimerase/dehydratase family protein [bacterium]|nr:NAD-dependent epimerase/dehydratase family protein [bacterium]MBU4511034.1 NAD-dependent epimerase/dehydratase family protein [bacterium]
MKRIVITGVNGIIGAELCKRFIDKGYYVIGIDRIEPQDEDVEQFEYVIESKNKFGLK